MHQLPPLDPMSGRYQQGMYDPNLMTPGPPGSGHGVGAGPGAGQGGPSSTPYLPPLAAMPGLGPAPGSYHDYPFDTPNPNQWQPYPPPPPLPSHHHHQQNGPDFGQPWYLPPQTHTPVQAQAQVQAPAQAHSHPPLPSSSASPYPPMRSSIHSVQSLPSPQPREEPPKKKKKRKGEESPNSADEKEKRTKTGRACDACRTKKIRCDLLPSDLPVCAHCKQYNLECTFYMPITETRFKKKRQDDERPRPPSEVPARVEGPTSLSFLLHTSLPASASQAYDLKHHHIWEVSDDGNGIIRVKQPPHSKNDEDPTTGSKLSKSALNAQTISQLVNAYFDNQAQFFPIISRAEFAAKANPSPFLLYSICGIGSTMREFPREIFAGIRGVINGMLRSNDILSDARLEHVQALLVLSQVGDLNAQPTAATASACMMRTASAIRMAQDLGLHRESHLRAQTPQDLAVVELRRRVWATCVIMDRWYGAALGAPLLVDLLDCDVLLPAGYDIIADKEPSEWPTDPSFVFIAEHLKLSIIVGRVLKTIYSPTGLKYTNDEQLYTLFEDMRAWKERLPSILAYQGPESSMAAGFLHLAYAALHFLFWRPFMRITYICPPHLQFALESIHWTDMARQASEALDWLSLHDEALDTLFIYPYTATSCALIQYHTWVRRKDPAALESLKMVRETALRWEAAVQPDQMSIRRKTCETMTLLYEAALKTSESDDRPPAINPTAGVRTREELGKAVWIKEDAAQQGGIWVVGHESEKQDSGLQVNSVISQDELGKERPPPELESTHPAIRARAIKARSVGGSSGEEQQYSVSPVKEEDAQQSGQITNVNPQMNVDLPQPNGEFPILDDLSSSGYTFDNWNNWFTGVEPAELSLGGLPPNGLAPMSAGVNGTNGMHGMNGDGQQGSGPSAGPGMPGMMMGLPPSADLSQLQMPGWRP